MLKLRPYQAASVPLRQGEARLLESVLTWHPLSPATGPFRATLLDNPGWLEWNQVTQWS